MSFNLGTVGGRAVLVDTDSWYDLAEVTDGALGTDAMDAIRAHRQLHEVADGLTGREPSGRVTGTVFGPPVPRPTNCFAIGLNYRSHVEEAAAEESEVPVVFTKFPTCLTGPTGDVELRSGAADYEAELVVVVGDGGRDIEADDAWSHVAGVTVGQDISDRALQFAAKPPHFDLGKSRDTYGPIGPLVVSPDQLGDPDALPITCDVNGEQRQSANTDQMIFDVSSLIVYLSSILTLAPGDLIFTGTPEGVGVMSGTFLTPGDVITTTIEGVGTMTNRCV